MRNRKLFAILTLVAFMMTLLPVAAFAAAEDLNRYSSQVDWDKTKVSVTTETSAEGNYKAEDRIKVKVYVFENNNTLAGEGEEVYVASERGTVDKVELSNGANVDATANEYVVETNEKGVAEFYIWSQTPGDAEFAVGLNTGVYNYLTETGDSRLTANEIGLIDTEEITFESASVGDEGIEATLETKNNKKDEDGNLLSPIANGADYFLVTWKISSKSGAPVYDEEVNFTLNKTGARLNKTSADTNVAGEVEVKVYADKAGTYDLKATAGGESKTIKLTFVAGDIFSLEVDSADKVTALDAEYSFKVKLLNINDEQVDARDVNLDTDLEFEVVTEPKDSDIEDSIDIVTDDKLAKVIIPGKDLEYEGDYEINVTVADTGKTVKVPFTVKEQGDITELTVKYDNKALALGSTSAKPTVKRLDADGISKKVSDADFGELKFSVNDSRAATINAADGKVTATSDDKYAGKTVIITVVDTEEKVVGTTEMVIGVQPVGIEFDNLDEVLAVDKDAKVHFDVIDADGNVISLGEDYDITAVNAYVLSKPADSMVSAEESSDVVDELQEDGRSYVEVSSNEAGTAKIQVVVEAIFDKDGDNEKSYVFTDTLTIEFGVPKAELPVIGAENLTMFIGSTGFVVDGVAQTMDQAPFIQDNRTFVPLRAVATALGATNEDTMWDPATQTITLVREDLTATMTIGNNVITLSDGNTVVSDVAPFIVAETGRTVIPFRAIAEACGADVEAVFNADGTTNAVTFTQK